MDGWLIVLLAVLIVMTPVLLVVANVRGYHRGLAVGSELQKLPALPSTMHACGGMWSRWEIGQTRVVDRNGGKTLYTMTTQSRSCDECGYVEKEKLEVRGQ